MPLRLVAVLLVFLLVGRVTDPLFSVLSGQHRGGVFAGPTLDVAVRTASRVFGALTTVLVALVVGVVVDRRTIRDYGFRFRCEWWRDFGFGAALGAGLMTLVFLLELSVGWVRVTGLVTATEGSSPGTLAVSYAIAFAAVSLSEELLVRGILLTNLAEGFGGFGPLSNRAGTVLAVALTSLVFGLLHAGNPNATLVSTANIALAGVLLAFGYVLTGDLAVPLGLHLTWNYVQGVVYGFPVSGIRVGVALVETEVAGPPLVTGGRFGPEAGLLGLVAILLGMGAIAWWVRRAYRSLDLHETVPTPELRWESTERDGPSSRRSSG